MLDDFKETQPVAYKTLINTVVKNRLSHAYIIETNNFYRKDEVVLSFAKYLLCPNSHTNMNADCTVCQRINDGNYPELKIVEPDGLWIKKSQMNELQDIFSKKAIEGNKKIYIIKEAEKLNQSSANSILKFLEEPEEGIIAILVTDNVNMLISTIASRCQIISLIGEDNTYKTKYLDYPYEKVALSNYFSRSEEELAKLLTDENFNKTIETTINFISKVNINKNDKFIYAIEVFKDASKEKISMIFDIMILFYKDILNMILKNKVEIFVDHTELINKMIQKNDTISVSEQIQRLISYKNMTRSNINTNLLIDKFIAEGGK